MEFSSRVFISKPEFKELSKGLTSQHFHAEVILIDRSSPALPQVYQLKADHLPYLMDQNILTLTRDAFINIGDLLELDTYKKTVRLTEQNLVTYKYLIDFTGGDLPLELSAALHTLKEALLLENCQIKNKLPKKKTDSSQPISRSSMTEKPNDSKNIEKMVQMKIAAKAKETSTKGDLSSSTKSLCQVRL
jgi:hypothetical protein